MDISESTPRTKLCKCGNEAVYIKDYWISEMRSKKAKAPEDVPITDKENVCGIIRRRYCKECLGKLADRRRRYGIKLDLLLTLSIFIPLAMLTGKELFDFFTAPSEERTFPILAILFGILTVAVTSALAIHTVRSALSLGRIAKGEQGSLRNINALMDSLCWELKDASAVKELPSVDVLVDGDGRANHGMERSGYVMKVSFDGSTDVEPVKARLRYPVSDKFEHIKRAYVNASFGDDCIRDDDEKVAKATDFDIKNGTLRRYSGLSLHVTVPEGVREISDCAFRRCKNCESIELPDSVTVIGAEAFSGCPAESVNIPPLVGKIEKFTFYGSGIRELTVPDGVTEIAENAFCECHALERVSIPSSCKRIGENAFRSCSSLIRVELSEGLEAIGDCAFQGCYALPEITLPDGVCEIGNFAFEGCTSLASLRLPDTVQFMGGRAFDGNINMTVYGAVGSYAESYANETRRRFVADKNKK